MCEILIGNKVMPGYWINQLLTWITL